MEEKELAIRLKERKRRNKKEEKESDNAIHQMLINVME